MHRGKQGNFRVEEKGTDRRERRGRAMKMEKLSKEGRAHKEERSNVTTD